MQKKNTGWKGETLWRILQYNKDGVWRLAVIVAIQTVSQFISIHKDYLYSQWGHDETLQTDFYKMSQHAGMVMTYVTITILLGCVE